VFGWRSVFFITGALGLLWAPLWLFTSRRIPAHTDTTHATRTIVWSVLPDRRMWGVAVANALVMSIYSLWLNWTTIYFVQDHGLTVTQANQWFAWMPPVFATLGSFFGASLAYRAIRRQPNGTRARLQICWTLTPVLLVTALVPFAPSAWMAAVAVAISLFACLAILNNLQMIPVDVFGPGRAAFSASVLSCSFALMQTVVSPLIGTLVDAYGFQVVCLMMSILPLVGVGVLTIVLRTPSISPVQDQVPA
jgi:ACS family hexuronate transporter-like MFS transporter